MDIRSQSNREGKKEIEETVADAKLRRGAKEEGMPTKLSLPITTSSSPCSSPSHEFSFTISFHSPSAAKSPSTLSRCSAFDLAPADDIFFHGHLLPLQLLSRPPLTSSPPSSRVIQDAPAGLQEGDGGQSSRDTTADAIGSTNSRSSSSSATSSNGDAKERNKNKFLSSLFMGKWRKASETGEKDEEEEEEKKRKRRAFDAMTRFLRKYVSAVEPLFSFRGGRGRRGEPMRRRPYSFAGNPSAAAAGRAEEWRRRPGELSAPASMRTSPANSGLLVAPPAAGNVGGSSEESTMEELRSAIEAAIAHCKNSIATKEEKCKC